MCIGRCLLDKDAVAAALSAPKEDPNWHNFAVDDVFSVLGTRSGRSGNAQGAAGNAVCPSPSAAPTLMPGRGRPARERACQSIAYAIASLYFAIALGFSLPHR